MVNYSLICIALLNTCSKVLQEKPKQEKHQRTKVSFSLEVLQQQALDLRKASTSLPEDLGLCPPGGGQISETHGPYLVYRFQKNLNSPKTTCQPVQGWTNMVNIFGLS